MTKTQNPSPKKAIGLGFLPGEARHCFLIDVPKGASSGDLIFISEKREHELGQLIQIHEDKARLNNPSLRVVIDRNRWLFLAPSF